MRQLTPPLHAQGDNPHTVLDEDIMEFARDGDILLGGDFNARTANRQVTFFDRTDEIYRELEAADLGIQ